MEVLQIDPEIAIPRVDKFLVSRPGRAHQMNFGAEHSRGKILVFLHADSQISYPGDKSNVRKNGQPQLLLGLV